MDNCLPEVRREKVFVPPEMTTKEIKEKYGLSSKRAREANGTYLLSALFLISGFLSVKSKMYLALRFKKFRNPSWRYRMVKRLFLVALLIFFTVEGCTIFEKSVDAPRMTKDELKAVLGNPDLLIIDVRYGKDWTDSDLKIRGATREDPEAFNSWVSKYPKDKTLVFYCA